MVLDDVRMQYIVCRLGWTANSPVTVALCLFPGCKTGRTAISAAG